ncbi:MAG: archease, partial [Candidatus Diapherotrites archaeon]|nr:archease [Candidatus Diapherotrites archaeon]
VDTNRVNKELETKVELTAKTLEELVLIWLEELLFQSEVNEVVYSEFRIEQLGKNDLDDWVLRATVLGDKMNPEMHLRTEVKAVTRHNFEIGTDKKNRKFVQVLLDI